MFFNDTITKSNFPSSLKRTYMAVVFKKGTKSLKKHCKPISILPLVSKIFGRIICKQVTNFLIILNRNISADLENAMVHNTACC